MPNLRPGANGRPVRLGGGLGVRSGDAHEPASPSTTQSVPVFYDSALTAQGFPSPLLHMQINGHEATFLVDSGASTHVLADWFVTAAAIPTSETDSTAQGSSGKTTRERVARSLAGHWGDGQPFHLNQAVVVSFPPSFESLHIGGLISPQLLAPPETAAVLDLKTPSLHFAPFTHAMSDLSASRASHTPACRNRNSIFENRQYVTPVSVGNTTDLMLVDTGATKTIFSRGSATAQVIESHSEAGTASESVGGDVDARRVVHGVRLFRGGQSIALDPSLGGVSPPCNAKGILGMDALRGCVLTLGDGEMALSCK